MTRSNAMKAHLQSYEPTWLEQTVMPPQSFVAPMPEEPPPCELPEINLAHLLRMTDTTGILQHATLSVPNFSDGYRTDDNARAFVLAVSLEEMAEDMDEEPALARTLAATYASFLLQAFNPKTKRFHNLSGSDRGWLDKQGPEDSHGRALWALGTGVGRSPHHSFQSLCGQVFSQALPMVADFSSPRAWAFALLGIHEYLRILSGDRMVAQMRDTLTSRLLELFIKSAYSDWHWFENVLTQDSAKLAHALIVSGSAPGHKTALDCGLHTLEWLVEVQTAEGGHFRPVGTNGFYKRGGPRANYDQQPTEAQAMVSACIEAYRATSKPVWFERAQRAFDWFLGWNDLGLELYSPTTGGCCDALRAGRIDFNQGAEATLAFLLSLVEMRNVQTAAMIFNNSTILSL
jgi:hypothetical protein